LLLCGALSDSVVVAGYVDFRNGGITFRYPADRRVYFPDCTPLVGTNFVAALYYLPGIDRGTELDQPAGGFLAYGDNQLALATFRPLTTSLPGTWMNSVEVGAVRWLEGVSVGQFATLQVRVWDVTQFGTYAEAVEGIGFHAASAPFNFLYPDISPPPDHWYLNELRAFGCVPEPSSYAFWLLGTATLLWVRARRQGE